MNDLSASDARCVEAAQGWLELGSPAEANAELARLSPETREHPAVLELRWHIGAKAKNWTRCVELSEKLIRTAPDIAVSWIHHAFGLHELKRTEEARDVLLPVATRFPSEWIIPYNLACYAAQLGQLPEARDWLAQAFRLGNVKKIKEQAMSDPDLAPLWNQDTEED